MVWILTRTAAQVNALLFASCLPMIDLRTSVHYESLSGSDQNTVVICFMLYFQPLISRMKIMAQVP
jgi:hypothetical protein